MMLEHFGFGPRNEESGQDWRERRGSDRRGGRGDEADEREESSSFRGIAARTNYFAADCPQIQLPTKDFCRDIANPNLESHERMKKLARYILNLDETVFEYP